MSVRSKRRIVAYVDANGVRHQHNPYEGTPTAAVYDNILKIAGKTNDEHPKLEQCLPEKFADFVEQRHAMWLNSYYGVES